MWRDNLLATNKKIISGRAPVGREEERRESTGLVKILIVMEGILVN